MFCLEVWQMIYLREGFAWRRLGEGGDYSVFSKVIWSCNNDITNGFHISLNLIIVNWLNFSKSVYWLLWIHIQILFNIFENFGSIIFKAVLVGTLNKLVFLLNYKEKLQRKVFYLRIKYLQGKYCLGYNKIPPWTSRILPG